MSTAATITDSPEGRLLTFLEELIIELAKTHPSITQHDVAAWLADVVVGSSRKVSR